MNFYIIDDDPSVVMMLQRIVEQDMDNQVVGKSTDPNQALTELLMGDAEIALVDLLMPDLNGVRLVESVKAVKPYLKFIMISQVRDAELREEAYRSGIEFFIDKPINLFEVQTIVRRVKQTIEMEKKLKGIENLLGANATKGAVQTRDIVKTAYKEKLHSILSYLGIASESGYADILSIYQIMHEKNLTFSELDIIEELGIDDHQKRIIFQRVRRALKAGLENLASMSEVEFENEIINDYANSLFGYKNLSLELKYHNGQSQERGKVSLKKFFDGLQLKVEQ